MKRSWLFLVLALTACDGASNGVLVPAAALPGTMESARRLALGFRAYFENDSTVTVHACLDPEGVCVPEVTAGRDDCHAYDGTAIDVDGAAIPQVAPGGFDMAFDQPGCTYPLFEAEHVKGLITNGGPQTVTVRIGGDAATVTVDDLFVQRHMEVPGGALVGGKEASVVITPLPPIVDGRGVAFDYDDVDVADAWCVAKNGYHGYDAGLTDLPASAWNEKGFSFTVPTNMPPGTGTLDVADGLDDSVTPCPFTECRFSVGSGVEAKGVQVIQP